MVRGQRFEKLMPGVQRSLIVASGQKFIYNLLLSLVHTNQYLTAVRSKSAFHLIPL